MQTELKNFIISQKIQGLKSNIDYYKNSHLPELREFTGFSQFEKLETAENKLNDFLIDVRDYQENKRFDMLEISRNEKINYIIHYCRNQYNKAIDFRHNKFIVGPALRNIIKAFKILFEIEPKLSIYNYKYLCTTNDRLKII